jgi:hypothetical protein
VVFKMNISCITTQQMMHKPVDGPVTSSISGLKTVSRPLSWADISRANDSLPRRDLCECAYPAGKLMIVTCRAPDVILVPAGGVPGTDAVGFGISCLLWLGGGAPVPLHLQCVSR